jgi:adenylate kinase
MKMIFIAGSKGVDTKTIINLALQRSGRKEEFVCMDFDDLGDIGRDIRNANSILMTKDIISSFYTELEKRMIESMKEVRKDMIINGYLTLDTPNLGYVNILPDSFFRVFKPDMLVILEKEDSGDEHTEEYQNINRYYGVSYALMCSAGLKIIKVKEDEMMKAVEELSSLIKR